MLIKFLIKSKIQPSNKSSNTAVCSHVDALITSLSHHASKTAHQPAPTMPRQVTPLITTSAISPLPRFQVIRNVPTRCALLTPSSITFRKLAPRLVQ